VVKEAEQAIAVMTEWHEPSVEEALQMLSGHFKFVGVRQFAVGVLRSKAADDEIFDLMIQLVQCIRFDGANGEYPLAGSSTLSRRHLPFLQIFTARAVSAHVSQRKTDCSHRVRRRERDVPYSRPPMQSFLWSDVGRAPSWLWHCTGASW
jgi:hypothetical protein